MSHQKPYKRKLLNLGVNRAMQLRMIGRLTCILLLSLLISNGIYYYHANQQISASFLLFHVKAQNFLDFLLPVVGISFVISLVVGTIASLFFPKNVAGALYRMEEDVRRIAQGDLTVRVSIRSGDEGGSLADELNRMTALFRETIIGVQESLRQAREISALGAETARNESQVELQAIYDRINKELTAFKVAEDK